MDSLFPNTPLETTHPLKDKNPWEALKQELKKSIDAIQFERFIEPIFIRYDEFQRLLVLYASEENATTLHDRYLELMVRYKAQLGYGDVRLDLQVLPNDRLANAQIIKEDNFGSLDPESESQEDASSRDQFSQSLVSSSRLNPNYTFGNFVKGPSNQFALATCQSVAENPGQNYNPLFLYGSTGLGKTHLLHAVGNKVTAINPQAVVTYISSERFMNEMIYCIRHNKMWDFRQKYRHCDVFMMDDIQFISGNKAATQEEFFHTFNTLYEAKKQIIITSDLFPQDIPDIEERLRNRFQWGLIADIQPPDIEHRIAILFNKADKLGVRLSHEVAEFMATHAKRNVRELEGALHRIAAFAALHGRPLNKALAVEIFDNMLGVERNSSNLTVELIQKTVADYFKLKVSDLKSKKRHKALSLPRQIAMFLCRQRTSASFPEIGEQFGGKDHTTVIHACRKIPLALKQDLELKTYLEAIERNLGQIQ